jgi:hypothetical protein
MNSESVKINTGSLPRTAFISAIVVGVSLLFIFPTYWLYVIGGLHFTEDTLYPFLDMHGRLAAFAGHRAGIDILYVPNPFDPLLRVSVKPTWPLGLSFLGLGPQHLILAGTIAAVGFGAIIFTILKPRKWVEVLLLLPICFSPPILLGIERGNDDIVYFILLALVPLFLRLKTPMRFWLAWLVIFMLAPAKYYPGAVFLVLLPEVKNWKQLGLLLAAGLVFVTAYFASNIEEILYLRDAVPKPNLFLVHGGALTFEALGLPTIWATVLLLLCVVLGLWVVLRSDCVRLSAAISLQRWFLLGYAVFAFCFLLNSNFDYRLIYILPMLPLLLHLSRTIEVRKVWRSLVRIMVLLLIPIFWLDITVMHYFIHDDMSWSLEHVRMSTGIKCALLWLYFLGSTMIAATLLRPNLRSLASSFYTDCKQFRLK